MESPGPAHARGELRTTSAGFPATKVVGCGETHSRVLANRAASSPDTVCRETVARQPTRELLASLTVMVEVGVTVGEPGRAARANRLRRSGVGGLVRAHTFLSPYSGGVLTDGRQYFCVNCGALGDCCLRCDCPPGRASPRHQMTTRPRPVTSGRSSAVTSPGCCCDHRRHGIDEPHGGRLEARRVVVAVGPHELQVERVVRLALDLHAVATLPGGLGPLRAEVVTQPGDVFEHDYGTVADHAADLEMQRGGRPDLNGARIDLEVLRRRFALVPLGHVGQRHAQASCDLAHHRSPGHGEHAGRRAGRAPRPSRHRNP